MLTPTGRLVASQDGYLPADKLTAWLRKHYEAAALAPAGELAAGDRISHDPISIHRGAGNLARSRPFRPAGPAESGSAGWKARPTGCVSSGPKRGGA